MREIKEKPPLKARATETLKSAPQAAFRHGADTAFQQLRQELREAAQDGQPEDRYESGKITEAANHTVWQAERLAEKALHKQPKAKSAPQQEGRTGSNPQHECPHPQQPATAPREYPPVSAQPSYPPQSQPQARHPVQEQFVSFKTDISHFELPEIKTKEYVRKQRKKQDISERKATGIDSAARDSETVLPVIRTREAVREQENLHVSHTPEPKQMSAPQTSSMPTEVESVKAEISQPSLPDIKSKQIYIATQQPTQVTPVQIDPQAAAKPVAHNNIKSCQPLQAGEVVSALADKTVLSAKALRVQKQARPAFVRKQKVKTAPTAKVKSAAPPAKALPGKMPAAAPNQAAIVIRKGQLRRNVAVKTAKAAKEAGKKVLRAIMAAAEKLAAAIGAGGAAAVAVVVVILLAGMLFASPLGILFAGEDTGTQIRIPDAVATLNGEFTDAIYRMMEEHPYDELDVQDGMEAAMLQNWRNVLAVYAVKVSTDVDAGMEVMTMDEEKLRLLREIFFDANKLDYELTTRTVDGEQITTLHISAQIKDAMQMADEYGFTAQQREMLEELLKPDYDDIFLSLIGNYQPGGTPIGPIDISDIQGTLPDDLDPMRETIVLTAYQLLGKVT